jgi:fatty-acyl-CoA synthase
LVQHPTFDAKKLAVRKGPGANAKWAAKLFPSDHSAIGAWGMTETGPMAASTRHDDPLPVRCQTHGRPMPGLELRIVAPETNRALPVNDEGEIVIRGTSVMRTYYRQAPRDCFDEESYFHTGDSGRLDENGNLHFIGRIKDVIKTAGVNVAAAEVEAVLMSHPAVKVAHVVPVPHPTRGENVAGFIVRREPGCTERDLVEYCRTRLASYKIPRHLFFILERELPVLGSGKVDRRKLRDLAIERANVSNPSDDSSINTTH